MTDAVIISLINTAGLVLVGIGVALINKKQKEIHSQINGMQEKLITAEKSTSNAEGNREGREELKKEQKDDIDKNKT